MKTWRVVAILGFSQIFTACGGGGGDAAPASAAPSIGYYHDVPGTQGSYSIWGPFQSLLECATSRASFSISGACYTSTIKPSTGRNPDITGWYFFDTQPPDGGRDPTNPGPYADKVTCSQLNAQANGRYECFYKTSRATS